MNQSQQIPFLGRRLSADEFRLFDGVVQRQWCRGGESARLGDGAEPHRAQPHPAGPILVVRFLGMTIFLSSHF